MITLRKDPKVDKLNQGLHNGFEISLIAYYTRHEKWAQLVIPYGEKQVLIACVYFDFANIPTLTLTIYFDHGDTYTYNTSKEIMRKYIGERQKRKYFRDIQEFTRHLTKEKLLKWWETREIQLPSFGRDK